MKEVNLKTSVQKIVERANKRLVEITDNYNQNIESIVEGLFKQNIKDMIFDYLGFKYSWGDEIELDNQDNNNQTILLLKEKAKIAARKLFVDKLNVLPELSKTVLLSLKRSYLDYLHEYVREELNELAKKHSQEIVNDIMNEIGLKKNKQNE